MSTARLCTPFLFLLLVISSVTVQKAFPQQGPGFRDDRQTEWPSPTAEDWRKPCLITWQRTWEDAKAVSQETGKPILVCVNMDGEIASEHYAGIRYRDPDIAKLYEPYVCVIASVYRHNPRDFDDNGQRILCPRFGCVTCGEHIAIEPILYEKYFEGERVAPRHIGVELDGEETYDIYYAFDTASVFNQIRDAIDERPLTATPIVRGDRSIIERVASRDIQDRKAVENAFLDGDLGLQRQLMEAAVDLGSAAPLNLLRLGLFGYDTELSRIAREGLAQSQSRGAVSLISEAMRLPMERPEREALVGALARLGKTMPKAKMLAVVHEGLGRTSQVLDAEAWCRALAADPTPEAVRDPAVFEAILENQDLILASEDGAERLGLAEAYLELAMEKADVEQKTSRYLYRDAQSAARAAEQLGAENWRAATVLCLAAYSLGDTEEAYAQAETALRNMPPGTRGWNAMQVLSIFGESRRKLIAEAVRGKRDWHSWSQAFARTGPWLTDVHAGYAVLAHHPLGTDAQVVSHHDFLKLISADGQAAKVLDEGLARFPESWALHGRLRSRLLKDKGLHGLEAAYQAMLSKPFLHPNGEPANIAWFAGYASFVAAEFNRRAGNEEEALAAYNRAIAYYERGIASHPESRENADHYIALALAGRARLACERGEYEQSFREVLASFERRPEAAGSLDGLNHSPVSTARLLLERLIETDRNDLVEKLNQAMQRLDPETLEPPAYDRVGA